MLFKKLLCKHQFYLVYEEEIADEAPGSWKPRYTIWCAKCGKIKNISYKKKIILENIASIRKEREGL